MASKARPTLWLWIFPGWRASGRREVGNMVGFIVFACFLVPSHVAASSYILYSVDPLEGATKIEASVFVGHELPDYSDDGTGEFVFAGKRKALTATIQTLLHHEISEAGYEISLKKGPRYWVMDAPRELKDSNFAHRTLVVEVNGSRLEHRDLDSALSMILVETFLCVDFWRSDRSTRSGRSLTHRQWLTIQDANPVEGICENVGGDHVVAPYSRRQMVVANDVELEQAVMKVVGHQVSDLFSIDRKHRAEFGEGSTDSWEVGGGRYTIRVAARGAGDLYQYLQGTTLIEPLVLTVYDSHKIRKEDPLFEFSLVDRRRPKRVLISPDQRFLVLIFGGWSSSSRELSLVALYRTNGEFLSVLNRRGLGSLAYLQWTLSPDCLRDPDCLDDPEFSWPAADHSIDSASEHLVLSLPGCLACLPNGEATTRKIRVNFKDAPW